MEDQGINIILSRSVTTDGLDNKMAHKSRNSIMQASPESLFIKFLFPVPTVGGENGDYLVVCLIRRKSMLLNRGILRPFKDKSDSQEHDDRAFRCMVRTTQAVA